MEINRKNMTNNAFQLKVVALCNEHLTYLLSKEGFMRTKNKTLNNTI